MQLRNIAKVTSYHDSQGSMKKVAVFTSKQSRGFLHEDGPEMHFGEHAVAQQPLAHKTQQASYHKLPSLPMEQQAENRLIKETAIRDG